MNHITPKNYLISERDITSFLTQSGSSSRAASFSKFLSTPILTVLVIGSMLVGGFSVANFATSSNRATQNNSTSLAPVVLANAPAQAAAQPTPTPEPTPQVPAAIPPTIPTNTLSYPDFTISAPIIWDVSLQGNGVYKQLENGVTHIQGTAKPGQKGTVAILGHSSHLPWAKGSFKTVFAPILKAKVGQQITLNYNDVEYTYVVRKSYVVKPDQMEVLNSGDESILRLITCTPLGTSLNRQIVEAVQISPNPDSNQGITAAQFSGSLPGDR